MDAATATKQEAATAIPRNGEHSPLPPESVMQFVNGMAQANPGTAVAEVLSAQYLNGGSSASPTTATTSPPRVSFSAAAPTVNTFAKATKPCREDLVAAAPPSRPSSSAWKTHVILVLCTVLLTLLVYVVAPHAIAVLLPGARNNKLLSPQVLYPLAKVVPIEPCTPLTSDEVRQRVFKLGDTTINLNDLRASMLYHMQHENMSGMCAQFLMTHRVCYCVVNMAKAAKAPAELTDMYNLTPLGYTTNERFRDTEKLPFCDAPYVAHRFDGMFVQYLDGDGVVCERYVSGIRAHILQILDDVQRGEGYCIDTNLEALLVRVMRGVTLTESAMQRIAASAAQRDDNRRPLQLPRT